MNLKPLAQEGAWKKLLRLARTQLPQSLVFTGPAGIGKKRAAKALFQWIHCERRLDEETACGTCSPCRKIAAPPPTEGETVQRHADLIEIAPQGEQIVIDDLREMKKMLFFPPMEGKLRLVIIDEAHKLNTVSANSLLKTLEEPPAHTRFILITHERALLLPTIVSRSQFVRFSPLDAETLKALLKENRVEIPEKLYPLCVSLLGGGMERAALFSDSKVLSFLEGLVEMQPLRSWSEVCATAERLGPEDWKLELFLDFLVQGEYTRALDSAKASEWNLAHSQASLAWEAVYLRRRLGRYANRKLMALAGANLFK